MTPNELSVLLNELLSSINSNSLLENESFIKRIWSRSRQLEEVATEDNIEWRKLTQYGVRLWNMTIEMNLHINKDNKQKLEILAMLKDTCFQVLHRNKKWKEANAWEYLHILTCLFRIWLDCDKIENTETRLIDDMKEHNKIEIVFNEMTLTQIKALLRCYMYQSEYASRSENWAESKVFFDKSIEILMHLPKESKGGELAYLYHLVVETGLLLATNTIKKSINILYWVLNSIDEVYKCGDILLPKYLHDYLFDLIVFACQKDTHILSSVDVMQLQNVFDKSLLNEKRTTLRFYLARLHILLKSVSSSNDSLPALVEKEFFQATENAIVTSEKDLSWLTMMIHKINQYRYVSISNIMDGLDLLIHRTENELTNAPISSSSMYLFKFYILSELTLENHKSMIELDTSVLRSAMDGLYLIKEDIDSIDLAAIQMILWRTGDEFYNKEQYHLALPWYRYTNSITRSNIQGSNNALNLAKKLSDCFIQNSDPNAAYDCLKKGIEDAKEVEAEDYLLLVKYALLQQLEPSQEAVLSPIIVKMVDSTNFKLDMFTHVVEYYYQYGKQGSILKTVLDHTLQYRFSHRHTGSEDQNQLFEDSTTFIHLLVSIIKCLIHIKTTVYESIKKDGVSRTRELDFNSISMFMGDVCRILDEGIVKQDNHTLMHDLKWMVQTAWNLGLFCFSSGRNDEGTRLFDVINKLAPFFQKVSAFTAEQERVRAFVFSVSYLFLYNQDLHNGDGLNHGGAHTEDVLTMLASLKQDNQLDAISILASYFQIELYVGQNEFEKAFEVIEAIEPFTEHCSFSVLERMAAIVLLHPQCPIECAFILLKKLQSSVKLIKGDINDYAKWTRILISTTVKKNSSQDLYTCFKDIILQQVYKQEAYPQHELYYLIVVAWNEGITCCFKSEFLGENWCKIAFELLGYLQDTEKKKLLKDQMNAAYELFENDQQQ